MVIRRAMCNAWHEVARVVVNGAAIRAHKASFWIKKNRIIFITWPDIYGPILFLCALIWSSLNICLRLRDKFVRSSWPRRIVVVVVFFFLTRIHGPFSALHDNIYGELSFRLVDFRIFIVTIDFCSALFQIA